MKKVKLPYPKIEAFNEGVAILFNSGAEFGTDYGMDLTLSKMNTVKYVEAYEEQRLRLAKKLGKPGQGGFYSFTDKNKKEFDAEIEKLRSKEYSLELISRKIPISEFEGMKLPLRFFECFQDYIK